MSYFRSLDEYSERELREELAQREQAKREGRCDYCARPRGEQPSCKFPERHNHSVAGG